MDQAPSLGRSTQGPGLQTRAWAGLAPRRSVPSSLRTRRLRVLPWQGDPHVALIAPTRIGRRATPRDIQRCLDDLAHWGVHEAVTPAMSSMEAEPFARAGFEHYERLHLLSCQLDRLRDTSPAQPALRLRPGRPWHTSTILDLDARAFDGFWRFDRRALSEAKSATPSHRFRVARLNGKIVGYAVTGRSTTRGYLQRLAVDPDVQGQGVGTLLVQDSFRWLQRRGAYESMVNTQESNSRALALYERLGFRLEPQGLVVLRWHRSW